MSEAERTSSKPVCKGILNKAKRGELQSSLPVGLVYNAANQPSWTWTSKFRRACGVFSKRSIARDRHGDR